MIPTLAIIGVFLLGILAGGTILGTRLLERRYPARGQFVDVGGGRLHLVDLAPDGGEGERLPVVLLHGASGNLEDMRLALGERLAPGRRVVMIDRPGHGFSDRPGGKSCATLVRQATLTLEALDALGIGRAVIVGYSWSGALATALALSAPDRVAGLVLLAPVTHPWPGGIAWYYRVSTTPILGSLFVRLLTLPIGYWLLDAGTRNAFAPQTRPERYVERAAIPLLLRPSQFAANAQDVAALKRGVAAQAPRYSGIRVPTAIITGDRDTTVSQLLHARALAAVVPNAKLTVLGGIGHMIHHAAPDLIIGEIERVVAEAASREPASQRSEELVRG